MPGNAICLSLRKLAWIGAGSSVFTLIAIARERYCAVVHPLSIQRKLTWQKLKVIIPGTWILAALLNSRAFVIQSFGREITIRFCNHFWDDKELQKAYWLIFVVFVGISSLLMIGYCSIVVYTLWFKRDDQEERPFQQQKHRVKPIIQLVLKTYLVDQKYDPKYGKKISVQMSEEIKEQVKKICYHRSKIACQVIVEIFVNKTSKL
ncbi:tachykinin-like peptides receptor 86C [Montipora capricornis]